MFGFAVLRISEPLIKTAISSEMCSMQLIINNKESKLVDDIHVLIQIRARMRVSVYFYYHVLALIYITFLE